MDKILRETTYLCVEMLNSRPQKQNGNVSWRRPTQIKQLAWPMAEWQIGHWKSSLVFSARFPVVKWRSRSVAKSAYT